MFLAVYLPYFLAINLNQKFLKSIVNMASMCSSTEQKFVY